MEINTSTSHPSAFISSTFLDLKKERDAVAETLRVSSININALDIKPASNNSSRNEIMKAIKESDFIILIIGERCGTVNPAFTFGKKISITRWEYELAYRMKKPVLAFYKSVTDKNPIYYDSIEDDDYTFKCDLLKKFKKDVSSKHNTKPFTEATQLKEEVRHALIPTYRDGVSTLLLENKSLKNQIAELESQINYLKIENIRINTPNNELIDSDDDYAPRGGLSSPSFSDTSNNFGLSTDLYDRARKSLAQDSFGLDIKGKKT